MKHFLLGLKRPGREASIAKDANVFGTLPLWLQMSLWSLGICTVAIRHFRISELDIDCGRIIKLEVYGELPSSLCSSVNVLTDIHAFR
jgi:hypothetical protein